MDSDETCIVNSSGAINDDGVSTGSKKTLPCHGFRWALSNLKRNRMTL